MRVGKDQTDLRAFIWTAIAWLMIGCVGTAWFSDAPIVGVFWFFGYWTLCVFGLFLLAKTIAVTLGFMFHQGAENRMLYGMQIAFWGTLKFLALGAFGVWAFRGANAPIASLYFGLGTLVVVPLVGGYWWGQRELRHA